MGEYELELISQHPALTAQNPLTSQISTLNIMNTGKARFLAQIPPVATIGGRKNEQYKNKARL